MSVGRDVEADFKSKKVKISKDKRDDSSNGAADEDLQEDAERR